MPIAFLKIYPRSLSVNQKIIWNVKSSPILSLWCCQQVPVNLMCFLDNMSLVIVCEAEQKGEAVMSGRLSKKSISEASWQARQELNPHPPDLESGALAS